MTPRGTYRLSTCIFFFCRKYYLYVFFLMISWSHFSKSVFVKSLSEFFFVRVSFSFLMVNSWQRQTDSLIVTKKRRHAGVKKKKKAWAVWASPKSSAGRQKAITGHVGRPDATPPLSCMAQMATMWNQCGRRSRNKFTLTPFEWWNLILLTDAIWLPQRYWRMVSLT